MSAFLCPFFGAGTQLFTNQGVVLAGGKLYFYLAGSTTPQDTWTDSTQAVLNSNPVILDSYGRTPQEIWLQSGIAYKVVVTDIVGSPLGLAWDNITGINDIYSSTTQWVATGLTPSYISGTSFSVGADQTTVFQVGRRVKCEITGLTLYGTVVTSVYGSGTTTVTIVADSSSLNAGLSSVSVGLITPVNTSIDFGSAHVSVYATGNQSCGTTATITYGSVAYDDLGAMNLGTGSFTCKRAGSYLFTVLVNFSLSVNDVVYLSLGTTTSRMNALAANVEYMTVSKLLKMTAGQTTSVVISTSGAGSVTTAYSPNGGATRGVIFTAAYLGN